MYWCASPCVNLCVRLRITPNLVSWLSLLSSALGCALLLWRHDIALFSALWILGLYLDFVDGPLARRLGSENRSAFSLDHTLDLARVSLGLLAVSAYYTQETIWVANTLAIASILIFTILNHDLGTLAIVSRTRSEGSSGAGHHSFSLFTHGVGHEGWRNAARPVLLVIATYDAPLLLLLPVAAVNMTNALIVSVYYCSVASVQAFRAILILRKLPKLHSLLEN
jgi:phosphatidylglycerophosphate synthase